MNKEDRKDLVERLRENGALVVCPFDRRSPDYWTTPNDKPCKFCGGEPEGPDKCTGADLRVMAEAADEITRLRRELEEARRALEPLRELVERAQAIISTSTYPNWHAATETALRAGEEGK